VSSPVAILVAVTPEAEHALDGQSELPVTRFPFKVGRESRVAQLAQGLVARDQRLGRAPQLNDVYLKESLSSDLSHVSRDHFAIERLDDQFFVVDRGSVSGTIVAGRRIGGHRRGGRAPLKPGDEIIVGGDGSPYVFRFTLAPVSS
jgi:FHA domain